MVDPVAPPAPDDDARLLARLAAGDERALGTLYDTYGAVVYGLALAITQDTSAAESVVTDAFAAVWREARAVSSPGNSLFGWLSHTVRTLALRQRPAGASPVTTQAPAASRLAQAIERLTAVERESIELAYFGGMSRAEIARRLGQAEVTISVALRTAMEGLRDVLGPTQQPAPRMVAGL